MAGIYFHIPFCRQACHYCDFHFSTSLATAAEMMEAMCAELLQRRDYMNGKTIQTVYFGGGTPSLIPSSAIERFVNTVRNEYLLHDEAEITLEANPDDLSDSALSEWKRIGINRLSIGIQSFHDEDLSYMHRSHSAGQARDAVQCARRHGFKDLTVDLIYGTPTMNDERWLENLAVLEDLDLPHFSAYSLTVEPRTALQQLVRTRALAAPDDETAASQFNILMDWARSHGYEHYEISNFAKPGRYSRHNTAYWKGEHYLGIGPSAHSFNGHERYWNIRNNPDYLRRMAQSLPLGEGEVLSSIDQYNEFVLTSLRTQWGIRLARLQELFGTMFLDHFMLEKSAAEKQGWLKYDGETVVLTDAGRLYADHIAADLFMAKGGQ